MDDGRRLYRKHCFYLVENPHGVLKCILEVQDTNYLQILGMVM